MPFHGAVWESSEARLRGAEREREIFVPLSSGLPKTLQCSIAWLAQQIFHYNYLSLPLVNQFACLSLLAFSEEFSKSLMCVSSYAAVPTPHQQRERDGPSASGFPAFSLLARPSGVRLVAFPPYFPHSVYLAPV